MSGLSVVPVVVSGASALFGGVAGTFLIEFYRQRVESGKARRELTRLAEELLARDIAVLQSHVWRKKIDESTAQLATMIANAETNVPYLPGSLRQLEQETVQYVRKLLSAISRLEKDGPGSDVSWGLVELALEKTSAAVAEWRATGSIERVQATIEEVNEGYRSLIELAATAGAQTHDPAEQPAGG